MNTISAISDKLRAEGSTLLGQKSLGLKVLAGAILAIPFTIIAFSMARMLLAGF